jgi:8-oxo-dGTP pyrophosphatase MutT (NUDIX family)
MVAGSILPITIHNNKLYFLFGKENSLEKSAKGWSDFGGGCEKGETPFIAAMREGSEELTGFLGDEKQIKILVKKGGIYKMVHNDYHVHIFYIQYDENLPKYYNMNHKFIWDRMDHKMLSGTRIFEKIEIDWFSLEDMKNRKDEFRNFYRVIVSRFLKDAENIYNFAHKKSLKIK